MNINLTDEQVAHLRRVLIEDIDQAEDHLQWLGENPEEEDQELQTTETIQTIDLNRKILEALP